MGKLLEQIVTRDNLNRAYKQVKRNKGSGGVDGMQVEELLEYLRDNADKIVGDILRGKYKPNPVLRVEIPKDNGKKRKLGIPIVVDRVIQQAIAQVLSPIYEKQFSDKSYGFRPKRKAQDAIEKCQEYVKEGYRYVIDMDFEKYFDSVNQSKLIQVLSETIKDGRVVGLIHKYLRAGVMEKGSLKETTEGVPQGGPLSPLLSNVMLNELDQELENRQHRFVRYADDVMIFTKSKRAAERVYQNILKFIEKKLFLKVNQEKTKILHISKAKYLGFGFYL
jgi:RNA-directed DNA polymerase